jgi:hypothetical protein
VYKIVSTVRVSNRRNIRVQVERIRLIDIFGQEKIPKLGVYCFFLFF